MVTIKGDDIVTIKEVAEKYHISQDTLRYYERVKMIPKVTRTSGDRRNTRLSRRRFEMGRISNLYEKCWIADRSYD